MGFLLLVQSFIFTAFYDFLLKMSATFQILK